MPTDNFEAALISLLPKMRGWAFAMTRNRTEADDLLQETAFKVLAARSQFASGTNFSAWVRRIMANHFISGVRSRRNFVDEMPELGFNAEPTDRIALQELDAAVGQLTPDQQEVLFSVVLDEKSYEEVANDTGCAIGTLKSRLHRARFSLRTFMYGEHAAAA